MSARGMSLAGAWAKRRCANWAALGDSMNWTSFATIPLKTPYSCLVDGLIVGTGNSMGRLDIRLGEVMTMADIHMSVQRKDGTGPILLFKPDQKYLEQIRHSPTTNWQRFPPNAASFPKTNFSPLSGYRHPTPENSWNDIFSEARNWLARQIALLAFKRGIETSDSPAISSSLQFGGFNFMGCSPHSFLRVQGLQFSQRLEPCP